MGSTCAYVEIDTCSLSEVIDRRILRLHEYMFNFDVFIVRNPMRTGEMAFEGALVHSYGTTTSIV
jgi:hypothetical protein